MGRTAYVLFALLDQSALRVVLCFTFRDVFYLASHNMEYFKWDTVLELQVTAW